MSARYVETLGIPFLGMTGKFHHLWGEVGGYKKPEALTLRVRRDARAGRPLLDRRSSAPDRRDRPDDLPDRSRRPTRTSKACEPWAEGSVNRAEIGVISAEAASRPRLAGIPGHHVDADEGAVRVLLEGKFTFDLLDLECDFPATGC